MMSKPLAAILVVALLLSASGNSRTIIFCELPRTDTTEPAELILSKSEASPAV